ncbi:MULTISPECIES: hypothetical protein [Alphaproteobacteria]|uniref:hypothetical protein n=1 Tax=Alphaproteobacteria TaxID=28211 RepID=UPI0011BE2316|nr:MULTISPECIES: hypothetical protein [Alphaproteobacteria]
MTVALPHQFMSVDFLCNKIFWHFFYLQKSFTVVFFSRKQHAYSAVKPKSGSAKRPRGTKTLSEKDSSDQNAHAGCVWRAP